MWGVWECKLFFAFFVVGPGDSPLIELFLHKIKNSNI